MMRLVQVRECDGMCCKESPRFPVQNGNGLTCRFYKHGCELMRGVPVPDEPSAIFPHRSAKEVFNDTCIGWPQNMPLSKSYTGTGGCCWQWVTDGH